MSGYDVLFYLPSIAPLVAVEPVDATGGAETQVLLVARALAADGLAVAVVAYETSEARLRESLDGVDVIPRPAYAGGGITAQLREIVTVSRTIRRARPSAVVTRAAGYHVGVVALAARLAGASFIHSSASPPDFAGRPPGLNARDRVLYRAGVRAARRIVVQTEEQAAACRARFGRTAVVIRSIAESEASVGPSAGEWFLWVGRAVWYKRPQAFVDLARRVPEARFLMVLVPGPAGRDLSDEVAGSAADVPNLEVVGPMPRARLLELTARAVAVVNTSDFEGMPNATLEGWARGVPALALSYDPDGLIRRERLGAFAEGDLEALAEEARQMWRGRPDRGAWSQRCVDYVERHHSAPQFLSALAGGHRAPRRGGRRVPA